MLVSRFGRFTPKMKLRYPCHKRMGGPKIRSISRGENKIPAHTGNRNSVFQLVVCQFIALPVTALCLSWRGRAAQRGSKYTCTSWIYAFKPDTYEHKMRAHRDPSETPFVAPNSWERRACASDPSAFRVKLHQKLHVA